MNHKQQKAFLKRLISNVKNELVKLSSKGHLSTILHHDIKTLGSESDSIKNLAETLECWIESDYGTDRVLDKNVLDLAKSLANLKNCDAQLNDSSEIHSKAKDNSNCDDTAATGGHISVCQLDNLLKILQSLVIFDVVKKDAVITEELKETKDHLEFSKRGIPRPLKIQLFKTAPPKISLVIADHNGNILCHCDSTPAMFNAENANLRGTNFFDILSTLDKEYLMDTFGKFVFKSNLVKSKTLIFSTKYHDVPDLANLNVLTCKVVRFRMIMNNSEDSTLGSLITRFGIDKKSIECNAKIPLVKIYARKSSYKTKERYYANLQSAMLAGEPEEPLCEDSSSFIDLLPNESRFMNTSM